jgi:hypothetical protein
VALISASIPARRRFPFRSFVLLVVGFALPRAALPNGPTFACAVAAWTLFVMALLSASRAQRLYQLVSAVALAGVAALDPPVWLGLGLALNLVVLATPAPITKGKYWLLFGVGLCCPALFYGAVFAAGEDQRVALRLAFRVHDSAFQLAGVAAALVLLAALSVAFVVEAAGAVTFDSTQRSARVGSRWLALLIFALLAARLGFIASVASLRTDLMIWSESPALVNLLKLHNHEPFYGPMAWANSYSYSPGLELTQYTLLRPFQLELSLRAHRALGLAWQVASAVVLSRALWPRLAVQLRAALGVLAYPALLAALASVTLSSLLAPHVHPDHLLMLCFCGAIGLCLRAAPWSRRSWPMLLLLPVAATVFKLTGAGIGLGLALNALLERRWRALLLLAVSGVLALLTIPLFDRTIGAFSAYAIRLQASHVIEWSRLRDVPHTAAGLIFTAALLAFGATYWVQPARPDVRSARRVLVLTVALGLTSLIAYLKHGGRENSLMPLAVGGVVTLLVLLADAPSVAVVDRDRDQIAPSMLPVVVLLWAALCSSWPTAPISGELRQRLIATHEREISFLGDLLARGQRPWSQGTAAWIDLGRRDTPRDRLSSASELELGHSSELRECEARLVAAEYDGLFLTASALAEDDLLRRLRPALERNYRIVEPLAKREESWASAGTGSAGYVILLRRSTPLQPAQDAHL